MPRHFLLLLLAWAAPVGAVPAHIDHIMIGVPDLDRGIATIERRTGVRAKYGGAHPGKGTRNAVLSLGNSTYLELIAPNPAEPIRSPAIETLKRLTAPTSLRWAITVSDPKALKAKLAGTGFQLSPPEAGARRLPDGPMLRWRTFDVRHLDDPVAPFFIQWADPSLHPSRTAPQGCTLRSLSLFEPAPARLRRLLVRLNLPVSVAGGKPAIRVRLSCPGGEVALG